MHTKVLTKMARELLPQITEICSHHRFILAGGTGLALQLGHRVSEDFDFFTEHDFDVPALIGELSKIGKVDIFQQDQHSLTLLLKQVKLSFFRYWDHFLFEPRTTKYFPLADPKDIALMKVVAIGNRGSRKDFVDLFFLLKSVLSFDEMTKFLSKKFPNVDYNAYHLLKSLNYFDDAEAEPMPRMLMPFSWKEMKQFFVRQLRAGIGN